MNSTCFEGFKQFCSNIGEIAKVVIPAFTAWVAYSAYEMGKAYFNKGQQNVVSMEHYKRCLDVFNSLQACLSEHKRLINLLFSDASTNPATEVLLELLANNHEVLEGKTKQGLFISGLAEVRTDYLSWHEKWIVSSEDDLNLMALADPKTRVSLKKIKGPLLSELDLVSAKIDAIHSIEKPKTTL